MFNRAFNRNAKHVGSKRLGPGELKFNVTDYNLRDRVFPHFTLDEIVNNPQPAVAYGPDNVRHEVMVRVVQIPGSGETLQIDHMDGMRQAYGWNTNTSVSVYHYTSGRRGPGGGGKIHNFIISTEAGGSCTGCGANI